MNLSDSTRIAYTGGLPTTTGTVTLFDSVTAFPPGGSLHLLGQQWLQLSIRSASDGGTATGTVTGSYSTDRGVTWTPFYSRSTTDADDDDAAAATDPFIDEIYIGLYKDVRFQYTNAVEVLTVFDVGLSLHVKKPTSKVRDGSSIAPLDMFPVQVAGAALTGWFRLAHPGSVVTGTGYSTIVDVLDAANPATQSTDARRPPPAVSANGLPIVTTSAAVMTFPVTAGRANTSTWGFGAWLRITAGGNIHSYSTVGGASANRGYLFFDSTNGQNMRADIFTGANARTSFFTTSTSTWHFMTWEYNNSFAGDARLIHTIDGTVVAASFLGALGSEPANLEAVTGTGTLFAFSNTATSPFTGSGGPNYYIFGAAMPGVTTGLLTPEARNALMSFERPT